MNEKIRRARLKRTGQKVLKTTAAAVGAPLNSSTGLKKYARALALDRVRISYDATPADVAALGQRISKDLKRNPELLDDPKVESLVLSMGISGRSSPEAKIAGQEAVLKIFTGTRKPHIRGFGAIIENMRPVTNAALADRLARRISAAFQTVPALRNVDPDHLMTVFGRDRNHETRSIQDALFWTAGTSHRLHRLLDTHPAMSGPEKVSRKGHTLFVNNLAKTLQEHPGLGADPKLVRRIGAFIQDRPDAQSMADLERVHRSIARSLPRPAATAKPRPRR